MKTALATLYIGTATVYGYAYETDSHGVEAKSETELYADIPCRVSYEHKTSTEQDTFGAVIQDIRLFCDPSYEIPAGSKIVATQNGRTVTYRCSSAPAVYPSHQEIDLTLFRERA